VRWKKIGKITSQTRVAEEIEAAATIDLIVPRRILLSPFYRRCAALRVACGCLACGAKPRLCTCEPRSKRPPGRSRRFPGAPTERPPRRERAGRRGRGACSPSSRPGERHSAQGKAPRPGAGGLVRPACRAGIAWHAAYCWPKLWRPSFPFFIFIFPLPLYLIVCLDGLQN
jgi:hypothetical protein